MKTEWIALSEIEIGERHRPLDPAHVERLAASIGEIGLQTPITVMARKEEDGWRSILVAGRHRLEALRRRGEDGAECYVLPDDEMAAELWEIDENLARSELTEAQKADHHARRKRILVEKGLVRSQGRPRKDGPQKSYAEEAAASLGVSRKTVDNLLWQGKNIAPDILAEVTATDLDRKVVLDELAATPRDAQHDKLAEIRERRSQVKLAPDPLNDPEAHEKQLAALMSAWNRAAAVVRAEFLLRIDQPVFDNSNSGRAA